MTVAAPRQSCRDDLWHGSAVRLGLPVPAVHLTSALMSRIGAIVQVVAPDLGDLNLAVNVVETLRSFILHEFDITGLLVIPSTHVIPASGRRISMVTIGAELGSVLFCETPATSSARPRANQVTEAGV
jgi:hypothetical protein